jgi:uncharacterized membrane protein YqiK
LQLILVVQQSRDAMPNIGSSIIYATENGDYSKLAAGQVSTYRQAAIQIDLLRNLSNQLKKYNEDVKDHK